MGDIFSKLPCISKFSTTDQDDQKERKKNVFRSKNGPAVSKFF